MPFLMGSTVLCCVLTLGLGHGGLWVALVVLRSRTRLSAAGWWRMTRSCRWSARRRTGAGWRAGIAAGSAARWSGSRQGWSFSGSTRPRNRRFSRSRRCFSCRVDPLFSVGQGAGVEPEGWAAPGDYRNKTELRGAVRRARTYPGVPRFLIGRVFYTDAASTIFAFMGVYATKEVGFSDFQVQIVLLSGVLSGPVGAIWAGRAGRPDRPEKNARPVAAALDGGAGRRALIPVLGLPSWLFWFVTPFGGIAFGGTSATDRALLFRITPPRHSGHFVGLFNMVGGFRRSSDRWSGRSRSAGWVGPTGGGGDAGRICRAVVAFVPIDDSIRDWGSRKWKRRPSVSRKARRL